MGKYISFFKEPQGLFRVKKNTTIYVRYQSAKYYLNSYNTSINKIISELKMLDNHVGTLRGYLNTDEAYALNRAGNMIMQELENFIISWKSKNLTYYKALVDILNANKTADNEFSNAAQSSINQIRRS